MIDFNHWKVHKTWHAPVDGAFYVEGTREMYLHPEVMIEMYRMMGMYNEALDMLREVIHHNIDCGKYYTTNQKDLSCHVVNFNLKQ